MSQHRLLSKLSDKKYIEKTLIDLINCFEYCLKECVKINIDLPSVGDLLMQLRKMDKTILDLYKLRIAKLLRILARAVKNISILAQQENFDLILQLMTCNDEQTCRQGMWCLQNMTKNLDFCVTSFAS